MTRLNEFIVGIVFFFAMGVLGYFTIIRGEFLQSRVYHYGSVIFEDVEGLIIGDKVLINGVESGSVTGIELMSDGKIVVSIRMYRLITFYENYKILLKNQSALGGKIIVISPGSPEVRGGFYRSISSMKNLTGSTIGDPLTKISEVIDENREGIKITIRNISEFSTKINSGEGTIGKLVNEASIHDETGRLIKELRDTVEDSREQAPVTSFIRAALTAF